MRNRWLTLSLAFATAIGMAAPVAAQVAVPRHPGSQPGWYGTRGNEGYQNGYREGLREGEHDGRSRKDYGYKRDDAYEDADRGYRGGYGKDAYRRDFRAGYEAGYDVGYRRYGYYGGGYYPGRYPDNRYPGNRADTTRATPATGRERPSRTGTPTATAKASTMATEIADSSRLRAGNTDRPIAATTGATDRVTTTSANTATGSVPATRKVIAAPAAGNAIAGLRPGFTPRPLSAAAIRRAPPASAARADCRDRPSP